MPEQYGPRTEFGRTIHSMKYRAPEESFDDYCVRYARTVAEDESHFRRVLKYLRDQVMLPAGRQQLAVGRPHNVTAFNCFVADQIPDDTRGIFESVANGAMTLRSGGGVGWDFSTIRPEGELIRGLGHGAYASGPVSFMGVWDSMCRTIMSAGERRGAMMGVLRVDHPDVMKFIRAKHDQTSLRNFNISLWITDAFMEALEVDGLYDLMFNGVKHSSARAMDVWAAIMENNWDFAEPGVLFGDRINRLNPLKYCEKIYATNPCFTGSTKVWTAYGPKTFKQLARNGNNIPVLTQLDDGTLVYRTMTKPRMTQRKVSLVRVTLRGSGKKNHSVTTVECTPDHIFFLNDGRKVKAEDLQYKDSVTSAYRNKANSKGYIRVGGSLESHLAAEFQHGRFPTKSEDVHHLNEIKDDNRPENIEIRNASVHRSSHMTGDQNPMRRFPEKNHMIKGGFKGEVNGMWRGDIDTEELKVLRNQNLSFSAIAKRTGCCKYTVRDRLGEHRPENHTVVKVEHLKKKEDVYCGTVHSTGRFFILCGENEGVLVSNCAEQPLPPNGACLLGSINLTKLLVPVHEANGIQIAALSGKQTVRYDLDFELLDDVIDAMVRAFDNVIDRTTYPLPQQKAEALAKRRMGIGVTGLANAIEVMGHPYATEEYLKVQDMILERVNTVAYATSTDLAEEKGPFPLWDVEKYCEGEFFNSFQSETLKNAIRVQGLRNGLLTSIAPTGTISMAADNVSSGVEPVFALRGERLILTPSGQVNFSIKDYALEFHGIEGRTADQVSAEEHVDVLCRAQQYVDSSISKTCNVFGQIEGKGPGVTFNDFKELYLRAYKGGAKSCTTFNINGKREGIMKKTEDEEPGAACVYDPTMGARSCE